jgi:hypothetical protein
MSALSAKQTVAAPLPSAARLLQTYLEAQPSRNGGGVRILLRAHGLEQPAIVTLTPAHRPQDMAPRFAVHWEAEGDGPYPVFDGILTIEGGDDYDVFRLALEGTYQPPLGIAGKAFDLIVGNRIADQTAAELLADIAGVMEARFANEEAAKPH